MSKSVDKQQNRGGKRPANGRVDTISSSIYDENASSKAIIAACLTVRAALTSSCSLYGQAPWELKREGNKRREESVYPKEGPKAILWLRYVFFLVLFRKGANTTTIGTKQVTGPQ